MSEMGLNQLTIKEAQDGLRGRKFSSVELVKDCLEQIKRVEGKLNAFITVCEKEALEQAKIADKTFIDSQLTTHNSQLITDN